MEIASSEVIILFEQLAEKLRIDLSSKGLAEISSQMNASVSDRYLYDKLNEARKSSPSTMLSFRDTKLRELIRFLGYDSYEAFIYSTKHPISEILKSCEGTWVNYVRQNSDQGIVYSSPVHIFQSGPVMHYILRGPSYQYEGEIVYKNGCLFSLFKNKNGKEFHHIYKIGSRRFPKLLQGVFSGISTANDPIGGRTLLIKDEREFDQIPNSQLMIEDLLQSVNTVHLAIGKFFQFYENNNLRLNTVVSYGVEDLLG